MLRKLGAYPRQNGLAVALRELGKIERTMFLLQYISGVELRRSDPNEKLGYRKNDFFRMADNTGVS